MKVAMTPRATEQIAQMSTTRTSLRSFRGTQRTRMSIHAGQMTKIFRMVIWSWTKSLRMVATVMKSWTTRARAVMTTRRQAMVLRLGANTSLMLWGSSMVD